MSGAPCFVQPNRPVRIGRLGGVSDRAPVDRHTADGSRESTTAPPPPPPPRDVRRVPRLRGGLYSRIGEQHHCTRQLLNSAVADCLSSPFAAFACTQRSDRRHSPCHGAPPAPSGVFSVLGAPRALHRERHVVAAAVVGAARLRLLRRRERRRLDRRHDHLEMPKTELTEHHPRVLHPRGARLRRRGGRGGGKAASIIHVLGSIQRCL